MPIAGTAISDKVPIITFLRPYLSATCPHIIEPMGLAIYATENNVNENVSVNSVLDWEKKAYSF